MIGARGYAAKEAKAALTPYVFERRDPGPKDVVIEIAFCGICHSDIHQARDEWGNALFPMVPGHEIVGTVTSVGDRVERFKVGDRAGVGCFVDSCRACDNCKAGLEQFCDGQLVFTYNGVEKDGQTRTYGGYSNVMVVDEAYVLRIPANLDPAGTAPLLCAGITTYSPLKHWGVGKGKRLAVMGLGGLGHMAVKFGAAFGADVTVLSTSPRKERDAMALGAHSFSLSNDKPEMERLKASFDVIIDTVSAPHDLNAALELLKRDGTLVLVGVSPDPHKVHAFPLVMRRRSLAGSLIGGIAETQEMLDFCGERNIVSEIEVIPIKDVNTAYERVVKNDVKYRFVIDLKTL